MATARSSPSIIQPPHPLSPAHWKTLSAKGPKLSARIWKNISGSVRDSRATGEILGHKTMAMIKVLSVFALRHIDASDPGGSPVSDGHRAYLEAVEGAFGGDIDYAMLVKMYRAAAGG